MNHRSEILARLETARVLLGRLRAHRANPNHVPSGPHGGEFAPSSGGKKGGKHSAGRRRRRLKRLEQLRREGHAEIAELRAQHRIDRKELIRDQRKDWLDNRRSQRKEWIEHRREKKAARKELLAEHAHERKGLLKSHAREHAELLKEHANEIKHWDAPDDLPALKAEHADAVQALREEHVEAIHEQKREHGEAIREHKRSERKAKADLKEEHKSNRQSWLEDYREAREDMRVGQRNDRREVIDRLKSELWEEFPRSKSGRPRGEDGAGERNGLGMVGVERADPGRSRRPWKESRPQSRLSRRTTHKANSAEAILAHCLRRRGWTASFRDGTMSGSDHLKLTEDIRQYGRRWLRHEVEAFFANHGVVIDGGSIPERSDVRGDVGRFDSGLAAGEGHEQMGAAVERSLAPDIAYHVQRFFDRTRSFVHELMLASSEALMGRALDAIELEQVEARARIQAEYLKRFEAELKANPPPELVDPTKLPPMDTTVVAKTPMSPARIAARAELYANAGWQTAQVVNRKAVLGTSPMNAAGGVRLERRKLGHPKTKHCHDCPPLAALGWQAWGTLPDIGETECGGECFCRFEFMLTAGGLPTVNGKPTAVVENKGAKGPRIPRVVIDAPGIDHPAGPLTPDQLKQIIDKLKFSASVVMGKGKGQ